MALSFEERKKTLIEYLDQMGKDLNSKAGADIFDAEFIEFTEDYLLTIRFNLKPWQRNIFGNLWGGLICHYIDYTTGPASWAAGGCQPIGTVDIDVNFIRGVGENIDHLFVKAKVISIGRRVVVAQAEVLDPEGWLIATATTNTVRLLPPDDNPTLAENTTKL
ncbi:MAG: PaaI family thioesterase [Firmicutes bacterium]|nr:PaaI family thioesterase [Bacillota bacterium]